jgi:hypothetical protein
VRSFIVIAAFAATSACAAIVDEVTPFGPQPATTANGCPASVPLTDWIVQQAIGVSAFEYERMRDIRGLSREEMCTMPRAKLERARVKSTQAPPDHPDEWARFRKLQQSDESGDVAPDAHINASRQRDAIAARIRETIAGITPNGWTAIGPGNIGGRIRAISPNPANGNDILIGGVSGGVWRTTNGGASWSPANDFMGNLAVSTIVRDPSNPQVVYAGTGEGFFNFDAVRGYGIYKSTDGGTTWALIPGTTPNPDPLTIGWGFFYVNRIAVHPTNPLILLAATSGFYCNTGGLLRSTNGGANWSLVYNRRAVDVKFDPNNANRVLVAEASHCVSPAADFTTVLPAGSYPTFHGSAVAVSNDGGATFAYPGARTELEASDARVEIAWAKATSGLAVAVLDSNGGVGGYGRLFFSTNGGATWSYNSKPGHLGNQGWYDNALWVDPTDSRRVVVGGLDLYRGSGVANWWMTNTPLSWTKVSSWQYAPVSAHADHHAIVEHPAYDGTSNRTVFFGNDGGMYKAVDVTTIAAGVAGTGWTNLNNALAITQFYGGAGQTASGYRLVGGTQDNGSLTATSSVPTAPWATYNGGDGGFSAVSPTDPNTFYGEYVYATIARTTNGGPDIMDICSGIADANSTYCGGSDAANFISPFILDPNNANTMLVGAARLWRSTNVRSSAPGLPAWSSIKAVSPSSFNYISAIAVAPGNSNLIWVGHNNGEIYCTTNGTNASPTWTLVTASPARYVMRITVDPSNPNRVFTAYGGYSSPNVYELTDATQVCKASPTATPRHNNLPVAPVRSVVRHPTNPSWLYAGTEVGVFASTNGGVSWSTNNDGPGNIPVDELFWLNPSTLVAATHGRGMFKAVVASGTLQFSTASQSIGEAGGSAMINVTRTGGSAGAVGVSYATVAEVGAGKATSGVDYGPASGTLNWADGDTATKSFSVSIVNDALVEGSETFIANLSAPTGGATLGAPSTTTVTITDDDGGGGPARKSDFGGDGKSDILFVNGASHWAYFMNGTAVASSLAMPGAAPGWSVVALGDFNGDGKVDVLWKNGAAPTQYWIYLLNGNSVIGSGGIAVAAGYNARFVGDFDGNGKADIVFENAAGSRWVYFMNGAGVAGTAALPGAAPGWNLVSIGDFNGDGKKDLLWQNGAAPTQYWIYLQNGATTIGGGGFATAAGYTLTQTGDFDGNLKSDLLFENGTSRWVFFMNGAAVSGSAAVPGAAPGWTIVGTADFNGDGKLDLLWRNGGAPTMYWIYLMNGAATIGSGGFAVSPGYGSYLPPY